MKKLAIKLLSKLLGVKMLHHKISSIDYFIISDKPIEKDSFEEYCNYLYLLYGADYTYLKNTFNKIINHKPSKESLDAVKKAYSQNVPIGIDTQTGKVDLTRNIEYKKRERDIMKIQRNQY